MGFAAPNATPSSTSQTGSGVTSTSPPNGQTAATLALESARCTSEAPLLGDGRQSSVMQEPPRTAAALMTQVRCCPTAVDVTSRFNAARLRSLVRRVLPEKAPTRYESGLSFAVVVSFILADGIVVPTNSITAGTTPPQPPCGSRGSPRSRCRSPDAQSGRPSVASNSSPADEAPLWSRRSLTEAAAAAWYAATDEGIYTTTDGGANWAVL